MTGDYHRLHAENGLNVNASPWTGPSAHLGGVTATYSSVTHHNIRTDSVTGTTTQPTVALGSQVNTSNQLQYSSASPLDYLNHDRIVCKFFLQGGCGRGENCSYLHELPQDSTLSAVADCNVTGIVFHVNAKNTSTIQRQGSAEPAPSPVASPSGTNGSSPGHHHSTGSNGLSSHAVTHHHIQAGDLGDLNTFGYDTYGSYGQMNVASGWNVENGVSGNGIVEYHHPSHAGHELSNQNGSPSGMYSQGNFSQTQLDGAYYHDGMGFPSHALPSTAPSGASGYHHPQGVSAAASSLLVGANPTGAWNLVPHNTAPTSTLNPSVDSTGFLTTTSGSGTSVLVERMVMSNEHGLPTSHNRHIFDPNCTTTTTTTHHPLHHRAANHVLTQTHGLGLAGTTVSTASPQTSTTKTMVSSATTALNHSINPTAAGSRHHATRTSTSHEVFDAAAQQLRFASAALHQPTSSTGGSQAAPYLNTPAGAQARSVVSRSPTTRSTVNTLPTQPHSHQSTATPYVDADPEQISKSTSSTRTTSGTTRQQQTMEPLGQHTSVQSGAHRTHKHSSGEVPLPTPLVLVLNRTSRLAERQVLATTAAMLEPMLTEVLGSSNGEPQGSTSKTVAVVPTRAQGTGTIQSFLKNIHGTNNHENNPHDPVKPNNANHSAGKGKSGGNKANQGNNRNGRGAAHSTQH